MDFYNEIEPYAAQWLENLIAAGHLPGGKVDRRSIRDITAEELKGWDRAHFFAGIGGWPLALRIAGWPATKPVWTGSCPCQSFSAAGAQAGLADERNLWPPWFEQIKERRPDTIFGEQVSNAIGFGWLDGISADLEREGYTVGSVVLGAHSVLAPHIRQRLYWVAHLDVNSGPTQNFGWERVVFSFECDEDGNCPHCEIDYADCDCVGPTQDGYEYEERPDGLYARRLGVAVDSGLEGHPGDGDHGNESGWLDTEPTGPAPAPGIHGGLDDTAAARRERLGEPGSIEALGDAPRLPEFERRGGAGFWSEFDIAHCTDGKARRVIASAQLVVDGFSPDLAVLCASAAFPQRTAILKGIGNAIVPQVAAAFIRAFMEFQDGSTTED